MKRMGKKCLVLILSLILLLALVPGGASAAAVVASGSCGADGDDLTWTLYSDGLLTISGTGAMADFDGGAPWKSKTAAILRAEIGSGVTSIGRYAFSGCSKMTGISIPPTVTSIEHDAFSGCSGLARVEISSLAAWCGISMSPNCNPLELAHHLYLNGTEVTKLTVPNGVTYIGDYVFSDCSGLTGVTIPAGVTTIMDYAFADCRDLESVTIANGAVSIGNYAFAYCGELAGITIPASVTSIGAAAFSECTGLIQVTFVGSETQWNAIDISDVENDPLFNADIRFKPAAPTLTAVYVSGKVNVNWNTVSDATKYGLYRREYHGSWSTWSPVEDSMTGTSVIDGSVVAGTEYQYRVRAYNGIWGDYSAPVNVKAQTIVKPAAPDPAVTYAGGKVNVTWAAVSGAKKYALYRSCYKNGAWTGWTIISTKLTGTGYSDTGVEAGYRYQYRMKAYNGAWSSYSSNVNVYSVSAPLSAPVIAAAASGGRITVSWGTVSGGIKYAVYRAEYRDGKWGKWSALKTNIKSTETSYADTAVEAGVKYQYRMKVFNGLWSAYSNTVTVIGA